MGIFDSQSEAGFAADHVHTESADRHPGRNFILVGLRTQIQSFRRGARYQETFRESLGRRL